MLNCSMSCEHAFLHNLSQFCMSRQSCQPDHSSKVLLILWRRRTGTRSGRLEFRVKDQYTVVWKSGLWKLKNIETYKLDITGSRSSGSPAVHYFENDWKLFSNLKKTFFRLYMKDPLPPHDPKMNSLKQYTLDVQRTKGEKIPIWK